MYSPILLWSKEIPVFKGHLGLWFWLIPARTGVQFSKSHGFALEKGSERKKKRDCCQRINLYDVTNSSLHIFLGDILSEEFGSLIFSSIVAFLSVYVKFGSSPGSHAGLLSR